MQLEKGSVLLTCPMIDAEGCLQLDASFQTVVPGIRRLSDLADVCKVKGAAAGEAIAYRMYRGVCRAGDQRLFDQNGVRHDLTAIRPGTMAGELIKTYGHHHPAPFPGGPSYPEVYEVLSGRGYFLMQRSSRSGELVDVYVVEGRAGQKIVIPPDYGHVTINPGHDWLVIANLVAYGWDSTYALYKARRGAAYYALMGREDTEGYMTPLFAANPHYGTVPPLRWSEAGGLDLFGARDDVSLYDAFRTDPKSFDFLSHPEHHTDIFQRMEWC